MGRFMRLVCCIDKRAMRAPRFAEMVDVPLLSFSVTSASLIERASTCLCGSLHSDSTGGASNDLDLNPWLTPIRIQRPNQLIYPIT